MGAKCCFEIFNEFRLLCCLNFMGQECAGIVPMLATFLCSVYIYWDDILSHFPEFSMLHAIKINCIYINEQVASIFSCNLRSDSELGRHFGPAFSVTPARRTLFLAAWNFEPAARNFVLGGPKFRADGPKFCTGSLICTNSKFCLVPSTWWRCPRCLP